MLTDNLPRHSRSPSPDFATARRRGISIAELCRQGLEQVVAGDTPDKPWMELAGMFEGKPDDSATIDSELYGQEHP